AGRGGPLFVPDCASFEAPDATSLVAGLARHNFGAGVCYDPAWCERARCRRRRSAQQPLPFEDAAGHLWFPRLELRRPDDSAGVRQVPMRDAPARHSLSENLERNGPPLLAAASIRRAPVGR